MPDDSPFVLKIDDSALDKTIEKSKKTATELTNALNKAGESVKTALSKAFSADQLTTFLEQVKTKVGSLHGMDFKAKISLDTSQIDQASKSVKALEGQLGPLQHAALGVASILEDNITRAVKNVTQQIKGLADERKRVEAEMSKAAAPLPGVAIDASYKKSLQVHRQALEQEQVHAKNALNALVNVFKEAQKVQTSIESLAVQISQTTLPQAIAKATSRIPKSTTGTMIALPKDEMARDFQAHQKWFQEQAGRLEDSISGSIEDMSSQISSRLRSLPDITSEMPRKQAKQISKLRDEYKGFLDEVIKLKSVKGSAHDILGAFEGPEMQKVFQKLLAGEANWDTEIASLRSKAVNYKSKLGELEKTYAQLMEVVPAHIKGAGGERLIPGTPGLVAPTTQVSVSPAEVKGIQDKITILEKLKVKSKETSAELVELYAKLDYFKKGGSITQVATVEEGIQPNVRFPKKSYSGKDFETSLVAEREATERATEALSHLEKQYVSTWTAQDQLDRGFEGTHTVTKDNISDFKALRDALQAMHRPADEFIRMLDGTVKAGEGMPSLRQKAEQLRNVFREPILQPGMQTFEFGEKLKGSVGNATGFVKRELANTTAGAGENLLKLKMISEAMGESVTKPFQGILNMIHGVKDVSGKMRGIGPQFNIGETGSMGQVTPYFKAFEDRIAKIQSLMFAMDTKPKEILPQLEKEILSLSTSLSGVGTHFKDINVRASDLSQSFRVQPVIKDLQNIFNQPKLKPENFSEAQVVVTQLMSKLDQMVKVAPALEPLRNQVKGLADEFLRTKAFSVTEVKEGSKLSKTISPTDEAQLREAYKKFETGLGPIQKQLNFSQVISDSLMGFARLARAAGDVGHNSSLMSDQIIKLIELLHIASTKGLTAIESTSLKQMVSEMDQFTAKLGSEHLPAVKALSVEYNNFQGAVDRTVGRFLKRTERGALPEAIREKFAPPEFEEGVTLERWLETLSKGKRTLIPTGGQLDKSFLEIFEPAGHEAGKKLTAADMFGSGRFELIDQVTAKTQSYGRALDYVAKRLSEPGIFENFYQPQLKSAEKLSELIQRLRGELVATSSQSPLAASMVLSLDTAQSSIFHTTQSFETLKNSVNKLRTSGSDVTPEWTTNVQKSLQSITETSSKALTSHVQEFQNRLQNVIQTGDPSKVYSALKEAMKLPVAMGKGEPLASKGMGAMLFGGEKSFISTLPFDKLMQVKSFFSEYMYEVIESGFGFKTIQRSQIAIDKMFKAIDKEVGERRKQSLKPGAEPLPIAPEEAMLSRFTQEGEKMSVRQKGVMRSLFEGVQEGAPELFPDTSKIAERASQMTIHQLDITISNIKRKAAELKREYARAFTPGAEISPAMEQMTIKGLNWEKALNTLEAAKQKAIERVNRQTPMKSISPIAVAGGVIEGEGESIVAATQTTKKQVVSSIDDLTKAKTDALKRQIEQMKKAGDPGLTLKEKEQGVAEAASSMTQKDFLASMFGSSGREVEHPVARTIKGMVPAFVSLNNQLETIGFAMGKQGQPLALMGEMAKAARQEIFGLLQELSKTGVSTNQLDAQVEKFNAAASDEKKVMTFAQLNEKIAMLKQTLSTAIPEYLNNVLETGDLKGERVVQNLKVIENAYRELNHVLQEQDRTISAAITDEVLIDDLHKREIHTLRELGQAYRMAQLQSSESLGPLAGAGQAEMAKTAFEGRGALAQSLIGAAWKTVGTAASTTPKGLKEVFGQAEVGKEFGGLFSLGAPAATIDDLMTKILSKPERLTQLGVSIKDVIRTFREANVAFGLGVQEPKNIDLLSSKFEKLHSIIGKGQSVPFTFANSINDAYGQVQSFLSQVMDKMSRATESAAGSKWSVDFVAGIQKSRDEARNLIKEAQQFQEQLRRISEEGKTPESQAYRIRAFEKGKELQERLGAATFSLKQDKEAPPEIMRDLESASVGVKSQTSNILSLWERLTNTVKTTRNNFADLFMYQVRWYSSMMLFWGVFNRVGETFKALVDTQHQIQRAVRSMREESGELVTHYSRLEKLATIHIFDNMIKWASDSKQAGEALYQLASAGLNVTESLAALGPVMSLVRATEADTQETVKVVAGVYNVLSDSIENNIAVTTKFKIISDVMAKVFNDHQVELSELNQGYRFAISSADMAGLSFYELSAMLGVLNDNMIKGMRAGRGLQQVLVHIAREPYTIAASFIELAKHMNVPAEIYAKLASPDIQKMTSMDLLRELSKIAQASGRSMEGLGRIMEQFDMVGGRTLAPLLLNFEKVDKTTKGLIFSSVGATEVMAGRMSTTIQANLRRIAAYFQASMYPMITGVHGALTGIILMVAKAASMLESIQKTIIVGGFNLIGAPGAGLAVDTFVKTATMLSTLYILSGQLPAKFDLISIAIRGVASFAETNLTRVSVLLMNLASSGPAIIGFFVSLRTHIASFATAIKSLFVAEGATTLVQTIQGWGPLIVSALGRSVVAIKSFMQAWLAMGIGSGILFGLKQAIIGLAEAFAWLATIAATHPVLFTITAISAAVAGLIYYFKVWRQSYDDVVTEATDANARFLESLGKLEQKSIQAFHAITLAAESKEGFNKLTTGMNDAQVASQEAKQAFDDFLRSVGITDYTANITGVTIGTLRAKLAELSPTIQQNEAALRGHHKALITSKELTEKYSESLDKQFEAVKMANRKASETRVSARTPWTDLLPDLFIGPTKELADKRRKAWQAEREASLKDAIDNAAHINSEYAKTMSQQFSSVITPPIAELVKKWRKGGMEETEMRQRISEMLVPPAGVDISQWTPKIEGLDLKKLEKAVVPEGSRLKEMQRIPDSLMLAFGERWGSAILKLDLDKPSNMLKAKQYAMYGVMETTNVKFAKSILDSLGITLGPEQLKKHEDALNRANERLLKAQMNFDKDYNAYLLKAKEQKVATMSGSYTAQQFASEAFQLEARRLQDEYIRTEEEFNQKFAMLQRQHPELGRKQFEVEGQALMVERNRELLKIQVEQFELAKKIGELASKAWQEGAGEVKKHEYMLLNVKARRMELEAAEKIAQIDREIAANVRVSSRDVQEAHRMKMEAIRLEAEARRKELEYNKTNDEIRISSIINETKILLQKDSVETDPKKRLSTEQRKTYVDILASYERQQSHLTEMYTAQQAAQGAEVRAKIAQEERRNEDEAFKARIHNIRKAMGDLAAFTAETQTLQRQQSRSISIGANAGERSNIISGIIQQRTDLSREAIAGIMGNIYQETGGTFSPGSLNPKSGAFGLAQWLGSRKTAILAALGSNKEDIVAQSEYLVQELKRDYPQVYAALHKAGITIEEATRVFELGFEKSGLHEKAWGTRIGAAQAWYGGKAVTTPARVGMDIKVAPKFIPEEPTIAQEVDELIQALQNELRNKGPAAQQKIRQAVTEFFNIFKDFNVEPKDIENYLKIFDKFGELAVASGLNPKKYAQMMLEPYKKFFEKGMILDIPLLARYVQTAREVGERPEAIRKRVFEVDKAVFEHEANWTKEQFQTMMNFIRESVEAGGISGKKLYSYLFTEVFSPSKLATMIDSDISLVNTFYTALTGLGRDLTGGGVPVKILKSFESAIKGIITSGEELPLEKYNALVEALSRIQSINLKEASGDVEKYWASVAGTRRLGIQDLGILQRDMMRFGATSDEVWKAIGDIADIQIRRMYATWDKGSASMKGDMNALKEVGEAFWWGMMKGVADFASKLKDPIRRLADEVTQVLTSIQSTLESVISDTLKKDFKGWQEYINKFAESLISIASKNISEMLMKSVTDLMLSKLGIEQPKPGMMTQQKAEEFGKAEGERQSRFNIERLKDSNVQVADYTKRTAEGVEKLVQQAEGKGAGISPTPEGEQSGIFGSEGRGARGRGPGGGGFTLPVESPLAEETISVSPGLRKAASAGLMPESKGEASPLQKELDEIFDPSKVSKPSVPPPSEGLVTKPDWGALSPFADFLWDMEEPPFIFHSGGVVPGSSDNVHAVLQSGEGVISRAIMRKFQEGGEVENPLQGLMTGIGEMVQGMIAPLTGTAKSPRQQQIDQIGGGNYGDTFTAHAQWQTQFENVQDQYKSQQMQEYNQQLRMEAQPKQGSGILGKILGAVGSIAGSFFGPVGTALGGMLGSLVGGATGMAQGGLVQWLASGGPVSQANINPALYAQERYHSKWPTPDSGESTSWLQKMFPWLLLLPMLGLGLFGGGNKGKAQGQAQTDAFVNDLQRKLAGTKPFSYDPSNIFSKTSAAGSPLWDWFLGKNPSIGESLFPEEFYHGGLVQFFDSGGSVLTSMNRDTSYQNMGRTEKIVTRKPSAWPKMLMASLLMLAPLLFRKWGTSGANATSSTPFKFESGLARSEFKVKPFDDLITERFGGSTSPIGSELLKDVKMPSQLLAENAALSPVSSPPIVESGGFGSSLMSGIGSIGSFFGDLFGGITSFLGFFKGGLIQKFQDGGSVLGSIFDWFMPSSAFAMPPQEVLPSLATGWETGLNQMVQQGSMGQWQSTASLEQAKLGVTDVVDFMKDKPFFFDPITRMSGSVATSTGGEAFPSQGAIRIDLSPYTKNMETIRSDIANAVMHESVHILSKEGQPLSPWNVAVDPKVAFEWAQKQYPNATTEWQQYVSEPGEVVARGVAGHLQNIMNENYIPAGDWPKEYDQMFRQVAQGLAKGELPPTPGSPGFIEKINRSVYEMVKVGRYPTDMSRFLRGFQSGGSIPGAGTSDTVPAMLTPGEFVINRQTVGMFGPKFFHALQDMAKLRGAASPEAVLSGMSGALKFAAGGGVPIPKLPNVASAITEHKITVANVMDEESVGQFLNTKKYGEVLVNKLGGGISQRFLKSQGV